MIWRARMLIQVDFPIEANDTAQIETKIYETSVCAPSICKRITSLSLCLCTHSLSTVQYHQNRLSDTNLSAGPKKLPTMTMCKRLPAMIKERINTNDTTAFTEIDAKVR